MGRILSVAFPRDSSFGLEETDSALDFLHARVLYDPDCREKFGVRLGPKNPNLHSLILQDPKSVSGTHIY